MTTPRLGLETVPSNSLQPSVPINDDLQVLDVLVQASVVQALRQNPPAVTDSDAGVAYILGDNPTGAWLGKGYNIAVCTAADTWRFISPRVGMTVYVADQGIHWVYHSTGWGPATRVLTNTADANLALSDADVIRMNAAGANTLTIQSELLVPHPIGRTFRVVQWGDGATTVAAGSGVTIRTAGSLTLGTKYASGVLIKVASDEWVWIVNGAGSATETKGADIASAATTDIGASTGQFVHVTGTTPITSLGTAPAGLRRVVRFADSLTLTHNATSLILPGGSNITTATNDIATFISEGSGNWRLATYLPASGATITAVAGPASATSDNIALFDGTTGKLIKDSTRTIASLRAPSVQTVTSAATVTPTFSDDLVRITAQAQDLTLANPTGTAIPGLGIVIRIKDNGTARAISYGTQYRAIGITRPTTTVANKTTYLAMIYNDTDTKWDVIATGTEA